MWTQINTGCLWQPIDLPQIQIYCPPYSYQDPLSSQNMHVLVGPVTHTLHVSPLIMHFFQISSLTISNSKNLQKCDTFSQLPLCQHNVALTYQTMQERKFLLLCKQSKSQSKKSVLLREIICALRVPLKTCIF